MDVRGGHAKRPLYGRADGVSAASIIRQVNEISPMRTMTARCDADLFSDAPVEMLDEAKKQTRGSEKEEEKNDEREKKTFEKNEKEDDDDQIGEHRVAWTEEGEEDGLGMEWVVRAVSPDGDGSHLHPLTRCKSASCIFPRTTSGNTQISRFHRSPAVLAQPSREDDAPRTTYGDGSPPLTVYKRTSSTLPWLSVSDPYRVISPLPTRSRPGPCRIPTHPQIIFIISIITSSTHLHACSRCSTRSYPIHLSFSGSFCIFHIESSWHPGLP